MVFPSSLVGTSCLSLVVVPRFDHVIQQLAHVMLADHPHIKVSYSHISLILQSPIIQELHVLLEIRKY